MSGIVLALDIGKARIGIAKSDAMGLVIKPLKTIETINLEYELEALSKEFEITQLVIGMPINIENGNQDAKTMVETTVERIKNILDVEIHYENESYTSKEAEAVLKSKGIKINQENKSLIDAYAAAIILEQYFNH